MPSITIRNIDNSLKAKLRLRAALNERSMEEEVRVILKKSLNADPQVHNNWVDRLRTRVEQIGGIEMPDLPREPVRKSNF